MNRRQMLIGTACGLTSIGKVRGGAAAIPVRAEFTPESGQAPVWGYRVVAEYPHDPGAYTQGLVYIGDGFFEGTGLHGDSDLREVVLETGAVLRQTSLAEEYFGEGIALIDDRIYQITWQEATAFVYDRETFEVIEQFSYQGEGWGLAWNGQHLVMSNGSENITYRDPATFEPLSEIQVRSGDLAIDKLNELEWIGDEIWANVYQTDWIARIDPASGEVNSWVDLRGLLPLRPGQGEPGVLNGIAWDEEGKRLFVTGKLWPTLFQIELVEKN